MSRATLLAASKWLKGRITSQQQMHTHCTRDGGHYMNIPKKAYKFTQASSLYKESYTGCLDDPML